MNSRIWLASATTLSLCFGCYTDLQDEETYIGCRVAIQGTPRIPNQPPGGNVSGVTGTPVTMEGCPPDDAATAAPTTPTPVPPAPGAGGMPNPGGTGGAPNPGGTGGTPGGVGGGPSAGGLEGLPPGCEDVPGTIFGVEGKCGGAICHGTPAAAGAFVDLASDPATVTTRLVDMPGTGACASEFIINSSDPMASLLITKLNDPPTCGLAMPYAGGAITPEERECIIAWTVAVAGLATQ